MTLALHGKSKTRKTWLIAIAIAVVAFTALAGATLRPSLSARAATCTPTGFFRDSINMTAALINPPGTFSGDLDATGCNVGIYYDTGVSKVKGATIHGANYFGVVINGDVNNVTVDITGSRIYQIGEVPFNGTQHGNAIYYRAFGTGSTKGKVQDNTISLYQKGGIIANGPGTDVSVKDNTVIGLGPVNFIAQNGIQIGFGAHGSVKDNAVSGNAYSGPNLASSGGVLIVGGPCYGLPDYTVGSQVVGNKLVGNDVGVFVSNLDSTCNATMTPTNVNVVGNDIRNDAVTNTTGNVTGPYQAGVSDQGNKDKITGNRICGAGYDPVNQPVGGYVNWIDVAWTNNPIVHGNQLGCDGRGHTEGPGPGQNHAHGPSATTSDD